jgi:peroxiredoxin
LQAVKTDIEKLGVHLVVLSPQLQEFTTPGAEKQGLTMPILTDHGNAVGASFGLRFQLPDDLEDVYRKIGVDLPKYNGDESWTLSMPSRIVIRRDGTVASAEADPDYTRRPEPEETLKVLRSL